jgi:hypothetical protein
MGAARSGWRVLAGEAWFGEAHARGWNLGARSTSKLRWRLAAREFVAEAQRRRGAEVLDQAGRRTSGANAVSGGCSGGRATSEAGAVPGGRATSEAGATAGSRCDRGKPVRPRKAGGTARSRCDAEAGATRGSVLLLTTRTRSRPHRQRSVHHTRRPTPRLCVSASLREISHYVSRPPAPSGNPGRTHSASPPVLSV